MAMTLIEGIGDEVIEFFIGLVIILIGAVAWWSTRIVDRPLIRTVLVFERRSQTHTTATINSQRTIQERRTNDQRDYVQDLATVPLENASGVQSREENKPPETGSNLEENGSIVGNGSGDSNPNISSNSRIENSEASRIEDSETSRIEDSETSNIGNSETSRPENSEALRIENSETSRLEEEQREILENMDSEEACVLRRRRLDFFQNRQEPLITSSSSVTNTNLDSDNNSTTTTNIHNEETATADDIKNLQNTENPSKSSSPETIRTNLEDDIRIKLKYINDDLKLVNGKLQEPLGDFKKRHFEYELANNKLVRLIFNGQVLQRDELTLKSCGMFDNCVVHCLVHQKKSSTNDDTASNSNINSGNSTSGSSSSANSDRPRMASNTHNQGRDRDLGNLFFAIITFLLGAAWYFRYEYAQLYTVTATVALVGLTGIFTVLLVGMYYPENPVQPVRS